MDCATNWQLRDAIDATRCLDLSSKSMKMRLAAGLRPDPLGELKRSPRTPSRTKGGLLLRGVEGREGGEGERERVYSPNKHNIRYNTIAKTQWPVSYTHLTLPTILRV